VTWWIDGQLVDDSYFVEGSDTVVNMIKPIKADRSGF
jgi:hypothetical protein